MQKTIKIGNAEYSMKSSAWTQFAYKNETGRSLISDIQSIIDMQKQLENKELKELDAFEKINDILLKIAYVMIKEADENQLDDYISFLKNIDVFNYSDKKLVNDIIDLACNPLLGQLQNN